MTGGFLGGLVWGGLMSAFAVAGLSLLASPPKAPEFTLDPPQRAAAAIPEIEVSPKPTADEAVVPAAMMPVIQPTPDAPPASSIQPLAKLDVADFHWELPVLETPYADVAPSLAAQDIDQSTMPLVVVGRPEAPALADPIRVSPAPAEPLPTKAQIEEVPTVVELPSETPVEGPSLTVPGIVEDAAPAPQVPDERVAQAQPETTVPAPTLPAPTEEAEDTTVPIGRPTIGKPAGSLILRNAAGQDATSEAQTDENAPPLKAFAVPFDNPAEKPLISIILIDTGTDLTSGAAGLSALMQIPMPLTLAVNATLSDAADRAGRYRSAGLEVLALVDLPAAADGADVEVNIAAALDAVPEAVGVMEGLGTGLQQSRDTSTQVSAILEERGFGMVLQSRGLNAAPIAEGAAATVFRDLDLADQAAPAIVRLLDQAAFRADQDGGLILFGRLRPETLAALTDWAGRGKADQIALAPVSAILTADTNTDE